jgi:hypothetical protein
LGCVVYGTSASELTVSMGTPGEPTRMLRGTTTCEEPRISSKISVSPTCTALMAAKKSPLLQTACPLT